MKNARFFLLLIAAAVLGTATTACSRGEIEGSTTRVMVTTVYRNQWIDNGSNYLWCAVNWDAITPYVLERGTVVAYCFDGTRQAPLPHVIPITYNTDNGPLTVAENVRFDLEPGIITFIMQDMDGALPEGINEDLTFRVVVTSPVIYD